MLGTTEWLHNLWPLRVVLSSTELVSFAYGHCTLYQTVEQEDRQERTTGAAEISCWKVMAIRRETAVEWEVKDEKMKRFEEPKFEIC
jgi:hypothetical protein